MKCARLSSTEAGIKLSGYLTFFNLSELKKEGIKQLARFSHCEIDCCELIHTNSASLALFLTWLKHAKKQGKTLSFKKVPAAVKAIASLYALDTILTFQD